MRGSLLSFTVKFSNFTRYQQGTNIDHPNNKQRVSRNLRSVLERTESAKQKFSKQSVTDEKVTETHKSNIMYFDGDSSSGPVFGEVGNLCQLVV